MSGLCLKCVWKLSGLSSSVLLVGVCSVVLCMWLLLSIVSWMFDSMSFGVLC